MQHCLIINLSAKLVPKQISVSQLTLPSLPTRSSATSINYVSFSNRLQLERHASHITQQDVLQIDSSRDSEDFVIDCSKVC